MIIAVSACLLGENCKYNGLNNKNDELISALKGHTIIPICPEVMGGLPTPRIPSERKGDRVVNKIGQDVTDNFVSGAKKALELIKYNKVDYVILQSRSPSCGVDVIYDGSFSGNKVKGDGVFVELLKKNQITAYDVNDYLNRQK